MSRIINTLVGLVLLVAGLYAYLKLGDHGWPPLAIMGLGLFIVDKADVLAAAKAAASYLPMVKKPSP